jgi:DNA-binding MarR family transcriptional regulator
MTTTPTPVMNPRTLALAHYAARAVLESVLARHGMTFQQSVTLRVFAVAEGPVAREAVVADATASLKVAEPEIDAVVDELIGKGLVAPEGDALRITDAGRALHTDTGTESAPITARIYAGIPEEDLVVAGRVLAQVAERANAELEALR